MRRAPHMMRARSVRELCLQGWLARAQDARSQEHPVPQWSVHPAHMVRAKPLLTWADVTVCLRSQLPASDLRVGEGECALPRRLQAQSQRLRHSMPQRGPRVLQAEDVLREGLKQRFLHAHTPHTLFSIFLVLFTIRNDHIVYTSFCVRPQNLLSSSHLAGMGLAFTTSLGRSGKGSTPVTLVRCSSDTTLQSLGPCMYAASSSASELGHWFFGRLSQILRGARAVAALPRAQSRPATAPGKCGELPVGLQHALVEGRQPDHVRDGRAVHSVRAGLVAGVGPVSLRRPCMSVAHRGLNE
jgi:hypothetical protein